MWYVVTAEGGPPLLETFSIWPTLGQALDERERRGEPFRVYELRPWEPQVSGEVAS